MDYKKIFRSQRLRFRLLHWLSFVPDSIMLRVQYYIKTERWPNFKKPKRFTEKLQLYKMKYHNPDMLRCTDKYEVRSYIEEKGMSEYLIPLYGIYDKVEDIDFNALPQQFVAKTTDGGGGNQVYVCKDKNLLSEVYFREKLKEWMGGAKTSKLSGREWAYDNHFPRRILIEQLIGNQKSKDLEPVIDGGDFLICNNIKYCRDNSNDLVDYKFFCFDGKVVYIYGISDRQVGVSAQLGIYDTDFNKLDVDRCDERHQKVALPKPPNFERMMEVAKQLSEGFPHVRVDLYNINGRIYFGELTFYDGSGYMRYNPDSFDYEIGSYFDISSFMEN